MAGACRPFEEHFWSKVDRRGPDDCWNWVSKSLAGGHGPDAKYGSFVKYKKQHLAHRVAYELTYGKIPDGLLVCHKCDNRLCCNPAHLFLGTYADNMHDRDAKDRGFLKKGERHFRAKLKDADVIFIVWCFLRGLALEQELARIYGVSISAISSLLKGTSYPHISRPIMRPNHHDRWHRIIEYPPNWAGWREYIHA